MRWAASRMHRIRSGSSGGWAEVAVIVLLGWGVRDPPARGPEDGGGYGADYGDDVVGVCVGVGVREMRRHRSKCSAMAAATASRQRERSAFVISKWTESLANISGTSPPLAAISLLITTRRRSSSRSCRARFMPPAT